MDRLWAGWRMEYVAPAKKRSSASTRAGGSVKQRCLFCGVTARRPAGKNLILTTTPLATVMLNLYPYNVGHAMVAPRRHVATPAGLSDEEAAEVNAWIGRVVDALRREYRPHGFNLGANLGRVSGAGVPGHLHWHIVPRWNGDTNFMPVLAETKVLPESIDRTYRRLQRALEGAPKRRGR